MIKVTWIDILGFAAGICTTGAFLPQAYKIFKTKKTHDLSLLMYSIISFGISLWLVYGIILIAWPVIVSNAITFVLAIYILIMKIKHG